MNLLLTGFTAPDIWREGGLLFFTMAVIATVGIDYYFSSERKFSRGFEGLLFVLIPAALALFVGVAYAVPMLTLNSSGQNPAIAGPHVKDDAIKFVQVAVVVISVVYALVVKYTVFFRSDRH